MLLSTLFYGLAFYALNNTLSKYINYQNRDLLISSLHAIVSTSLSILLLSGIIQDNIYLKYSPITIGYALYDINNLRHPEAKNSFVLIFHHIIIIFCNTWLIKNRVSYVLKIVSINYLTEISTPFLNLSFFLHKNNLKNFKLCNINLFNVTSVCLLISYFIFRVLLLTYLVWETAFYNYLYFFQIGLTLINYYWFYKLLKMAKIV
jgi:hypothetical protein